MNLRVRVNWGKLGYAPQKKIFRFSRCVCVPKREKRERFSR